MGADLTKSLDRKLSSIAAGDYTPADFIIADAKDADMAFGTAAAGIAPGQTPARLRTRREYVAAMTAMVRTEAVDIMLASAANAEELSSTGVMSGTSVTLATRANDATDIWNQRGGGYTTFPSRPFRSANVRAVSAFCDLALYSVTFNNDPELDLATLEAYRSFRDDASSVGMRHILEVFNPNAPTGLSTGDVGAFVNDSIVRTMAGLTRAERPLFLKVAYNGASSLAELVDHDPEVVVGVLGGAAGTTRDTFELLDQAHDHGARVALFGRKIQQAESQGDLVRLMRAVLCRDLSPTAAVHHYHEALESAKVPARRALQEDLAITDPVLEAG